MQGHDYFKGREGSRQPKPLQVGGSGVSMGWELWLQCAPSLFAAVLVPGILISSQLLNSFWQEKNSTERSQFHPRRGRPFMSSRGARGQQRLGGACLRGGYITPRARGTVHPTDSWGSVCPRSAEGCTFLWDFFQVFNNREQRAQAVCLFRACVWGKSPPCRTREPFCPCPSSKPPPEPVGDGRRGRHGCEIGPHAEPGLCCGGGGGARGMQAAQPPARA